MIIFAHILKKKFFTGILNTHDNFFILNTVLFHTYLCFYGIKYLYLIYSIYVYIFQQFAQVIEPVKLSTAYDIIFIFWIYLYNVKLLNESLEY